MERYLKGLIWFCVLVARYVGSDSKHVVAMDTRDGTEAWVSTFEACFKVAVLQQAFRTKPPLETTANHWMGQGSWNDDTVSSNYHTCLHS